MFGVGLSRVDVGVQIYYVFQFLSSFTCFFIALINFFKYRSKVFLCLRLINFSEIGPMLIFFLNKKDKLIVIAN